ncbi:hypothetical protein BY458DRAFT_505336 [Sporodiniella umbellata]|nr:hypothetical protein BY458DRAFT_505336 [Sporodiniella umbellata]
MMISEPTHFAHSLNLNDIQKPLTLSSSPQYRNNSPVQQASSNLDDVTTIFVVGFPEDMSEREFQNMFTFCRGFEAASLKWHCKDQEDDSMPSNGGKKQMIGFARFRTRLEALGSIDILNGKKIDQEKGTVLKAEMAKKNLHIKRTTQSNAILPSTLETSVSSSSIYDTFSPLPSDLLQDLKTDLYMDPLSPNSLTDSFFGIHSLDQDLGFTSRLGLIPSLHQQHMKLKFVSDSEPEHYMSNNNTTRIQRPADQNPPCNTLYVGNLPPNTSEEELKLLFSNLPGYRRMCFRTKSQGPMCFIEFDDIVCASQALNELQGQPLTNSVKGGIRLSYSKNPLFIKPNKEPSYKPLMSDRRDFIFDPQL